MAGIFLLERESAVKFFPSVDNFHTPGRFFYARSKVSSKFSPDGIRDLVNKKGEFYARS